MSRARALAVLAALAALVFSMANMAYASHAWNDYHWARTTNSFSLKVVDSISSDWQAEFDQALDDWDQAAAIDFTNGGTDEGTRARKQCRAVTGQIRVCNAAYGQNGWLGLASINIDANHHITKGTAKMNDSYGWYFAEHPYEKDHVICQEIGHLFGLGHTSEDGSSQDTCMDYSESEAAGDSTSPNQHDYNMLADIYGHLDSYNSYDDGTGDGGGSGCHGNNPKCNGSSSDGREFGQLVSSSDHHEVFVRRNADGTTTITHLYLAR